MTAKMPIFSFALAAIFWWQKGIANDWNDWGVGLNNDSYHIACDTYASVDSRNFFAQIGARYAKRAGPFAPRAGLIFYFHNGFNDPVGVQNRLEQIKIRIGSEERVFLAIRSDTWLQSWYFMESYLAFVTNSPENEIMHVTTPDGRTYSYPLDGAAWALTAVAKACDTTWP